MRSKEKGQTISTVRVLVRPIPVFFILSICTLVVGFALDLFPDRVRNQALLRDFFFMGSSVAFGSAVMLVLRGLENPSRKLCLMVIGVSFVIFSQCVNVLDEIGNGEEGSSWAFLTENAMLAGELFLYSGLFCLLTGTSLMLVEMQSQNSAILRETEIQFRVMDEKRQASEILSAQTKVLDTSAEGYAILDAEKKVAWVSKRMERMFGLDRNRTIGMDGEDFLRERVAPSFDPSEQYESRILGSYSDAVEHKFILRLATDESRSEEWLEYHSLPIESGLYAGGRIEHYKDITELKRAEAALLSASRIEATATLAGGVAHDFNNLMVAVMGNAELLKEELGDNPAHDAMLASIIHAADRAGYLATQMLNFARSGGFYPRSVDLGETVRDVLKFRRQSTPTGIVIDFEPAHDLWPIWGDPAQIHEVLNNLLNNAIEAIESEGVVRIRIANVQDAVLHTPTGSRELSGGYVRLTVDDDGPGMDPRTRARVFEPFFTTKFQGRGIGLASAYGIVRTHKGHISVESDVGKGTTFELLFPVHETQTENVVAGQESDTQNGRRTILIVDDEEVVVDVTQRILQAKGYRVLTANSGEEGIEICNRHSGPIALAILDLAMPTMGAVETYPLLKERRPDTKVLLFSGYEMDNSVKDLLAAGADAFLRKPVRSEVLLNEIKRILGNREIIA